MAWLPVRTSRVSVLARPVMLPDSVGCPSGITGSSMRDGGSSGFRMLGDSLIRVRSPCAVVSVFSPVVNVRSRLQQYR